MPTSHRSVRALALAAALAVPVQAVRGQQNVGLELPMVSLEKIAADIDDGRNPIYCYFGQRTASPDVRVTVDSVTRVSTLNDCHGIGVAFVTRIADPAFMAHALRGLILSNMEFAVASAFYRTEDIEHEGMRVHAARAFSVLRGVESLVRGSGGF